MGGNHQQVSCKHAASYCCDIKVQILCSNGELQDCQCGLSTHQIFLACTGILAMCCAVLCCVMCTGQRHAQPICADISIACINGDSLQNMAGATLGQKWMCGTTTCFDVELCDGCSAKWAKSCIGGCCLTSFTVNMRACSNLC